YASIVLPIKLNSKKERFHSIEECGEQVFGDGCDSTDKKLTTMDWLFVYPQGMEKLVMYMKDRFNNTPIIITENGIAESDDSDFSLEDAINDTPRVEFMHSYLNSLANAMREGANVRGYFAWSLLDNFEWLDGYTKRFGLHYVNFTNLQRTPKLSATRYKELITNFQSQLATHTS
ncbi:Beta-glucosidase 16, partial [Capsicum chinense]